MGMLSYFPSDPGVRGAIVALLAQICPHREALEWLVDAMINKVGAWKGPMELRGVLCWHYRPADGIEVDATTAGFRPVDSELAVIERHEEIKELVKAAPMLKLVRGYLQ